MHVFFAVADADTVARTFDVGAIAGLLSQFAGVTAGFAFAALFFLLQADLEWSRSEVSATRVVPAAGQAFANAVRMLMTSFLCLLMAALAFSFVGSEPVTTTRALAEYVSSVGIFALAFMLLVAAIVLTLDAFALAGPSTRTPLANIARSLRRTLAIVFVPATMFLMSPPMSTFLETQNTITARDIYDKAMPVLAGIELVGGAFYYRLAERSKIRQWNAAQRTTAITRLSATAIYVSLAALVMVGSMSLLFPEGTVSWEGVAVTFPVQMITSVVLVLLLRVLARSAESDAPTAPTIDLRENVTTSPAEHAE